MAYDKKPNYPSLKKPGVYPPGTDKELGLNSDNLEKFSLGSWEESFSDRSIIIDNPEYPLIQENINDIVITTSLLPEDKETLFGFTYVEAVSDTDINVTDKSDLVIKFESGEIIFPLVYDYLNQPDYYAKTSPPVKIKFGIEHFDENAQNFNNLGQTEFPTIEDYLTTQIGNVTGSMIIDDEKQINNSLVVDHTEWTLRYPYQSGGSNSNFDGDDITIRYKFEMASYTNSENKSIGRPAVQLEILFNNGIDANNLLRIMNKVRIYNNDNNPGSEYKITSIKPYSDYYPDETGNIKNKIGGVLLDKIFPFGPEGPAGRGAFLWERGAPFYGNTAGNRSNPSSDLPPFDGVYDFNNFKDEYEYGQNLTPTPLPWRDEDYDRWERPDYGNDMYLTPVSINNSQITAEHDTTGRRQGLDDLKEKGMWDMYWRNPHGNPHAQESNDVVLFEGNGGIIKIRGTQANDMMFGNPEDTLSVDSEIFPNPVTTLGQAEPSIKKIGGEFIFNNKGGGNQGLGKFLPKWESGQNLWKDSDRDIGSSTWHAHTGQWDSSFEPHGYINANANLPHGYNIESANRTGLPEHDSDSYGIREVGSQAGINTSRDHSLPTIFPRASNPNHVQVRLINDSKIRIYGKEVLLDVPRSGIFRVVVSFELYTSQRPSTHSFKLGVGVKPNTGSATLSANRNTDWIPDDRWEETITDMVHIWTLNEPGDGSLITSNLFLTTPTGDGDTDPLDLDVFLEIDMKGVYKNSVGDDSTDSWPTDGVGQSVSNRDYYRGCVVTIKDIQLQPIDLSALQAASNLESLYKYRVLQWGDEKKLLTDDELLNTFYLNFYNQDNPNIWDIKKYLNDFNSAKYIKTNSQLNLSEHIYNKPGLKSIKTIVFRTNTFLYSVDESKIITTNIVINDGTLTSQDFSIFGGADFKFLPLKDNQVIIGGLDEDSKYNNSVEKIKKDDNFIVEDYLERQSSTDFIDNFNKKLYGESPGQLDLSTTRMYKKPFDIYDFITDDKQSIVDNNFNINTLPTNSSATDIFISNNDCIVDLNPQDVEYLSIQNKTGTADKAILIGDYKVNQPKDGKIQRQGVMETPLLEQNTDKQAF
jgi:hypothetical protein